MAEPKTAPKPSKGKRIPVKVVPSEHHIEVLEHVERPGYFQLWMPMGFTKPVATKFNADCPF